ncbi:hypothetical protein BDZ91DRAFT_852138 [Kalaharituber pfeilii]|nr:hypothetical protein BDZ91DRAFT_852138 [Kalaharituber pfeilii]
MQNQRQREATMATLEVQPARTWKQVFADFRNWTTQIFQDDTIALKSNPQIIGVATMTWHEHDEGSFEDTDEVVAGENVTDAAMESFMLTGGQPPQHHLVFQPASPAYSLQLVRECDVVLLDRAFAFGNVVKRSPMDAISGTVINVDLNANIVHCFIENDQRAGLEEQGSNAAVPSSNFSGGVGSVRDVPDDELRLATEWDEGAFVIWKNCWLGMIERIEYNVALKLSNGSVVIPEDCSSLEVPVGIPGMEPATTKPHSVPAPVMMTVGQQIVTKKGNLRKGKWIFGAYDPNVPPIGVVVDVQVAYMGINWCCQNIAVDEFVAVSTPPTWLESNDLQNLRPYKTSTRGLRTPETGFGVANAAVGDKVRFKNLDEAVKKYDGRSVEEGGLGKGKVIKIPRAESLGFDVNTFIVEMTTSWVDVQWQDLTVTRHLSRELTQYPNVDEHELWPGEIVIVKTDTGEDSSINTPPPPSTAARPTTHSEDDMSDTSQDLPPEIVTPKKVGVVQFVDAKERVAKVRWFANPKMELAGTFLVPGSTTGQLREEVEEVSFYEVVAHQALSIRRGDFVILLPETRPREASEAQEQTEDTNSNSASQASQVFRQLAFLANMASSPIASLQAISNFFSTLRSQESQGNNEMRLVNQNEHFAFMDEPTEWFGEVVDLGLDGLVTVRLGALDQPRDVKLPIERLTVILSEPSDIDGWDSEDDESTDDDYDSQEDDDIWNDPMIEESVVYEGGVRLDNDDGDDAWLTDPDDDMDLDRPGTGGGGGSILNFGNEDAIMSDPIDAVSHGAIMSPPSSQSSSQESVPEQVPVLSQQHTSSQPEPEAFKIPEGAEKPPGFAILETEIPADHAFASTPPTDMDANVLRRVHKEHNILRTSLPEGILVRTWESRLDLLRVLIIGPLNTPYELAPFVFDFHLGPEFPSGPPHGYFHSWTGGVGRVNPNLYEEGKICLSLLGTWHAQSYSEGWTIGSSILQLLVSLMGLVLVREPYYNEAGFAIYVNTTEASINSLLYSEKAYTLARGFIKRVLTRPVAGFEEEIGWLYLPECEKHGGMGLLRKVVEGMRKVVRRSERRGEGEGMPQDIGTEG